MKGYLQTFLWIILSATSVQCTSVEKDLSLTLQQKLVLDKFAKIMEHRLPHDYMKKEIYLVRWLRARNFDLSQAERMLMDNLKWREDNRMDGILQEDFSDVERDFKYHISGFDVEGKPVAYFNAGDWDIRKGIVSGRYAKGLRYLDRYLEEITSLVRKIQSEGANVTQYSFVINMDGFNLVQHGCVQCIPAYLSFVNTYENRFPGACDHMFIINTPRVFETILNTARLAMSQTTRDALQIYGLNKREWQPELFKVIPREALPLEIGGTQAYY